MLEVTCGDCGAKFKVPPKFAGSKMRCKHCSGTIVIGEDTYEAVKDKFKLYKLDDVQVKGKSNKVAIYSIK